MNERAEKSKMVTMAQVVRTMRKGYTHLLRIPKWFFEVFDIDRADLEDHQYFLCYVKEGENEIRIRPASVSERLTGHQVILYLNKLWPEPSDAEKSVFLELEQMHRLDPPRVVRLGKADNKKKANYFLVNYPYSRLTEREIRVYLDLPEDTPFTMVDLAKYGMSKTARTQLVKRCLETQMIKELKPERTDKPGRPVRRFIRANDFPTEPPEKQ